MNSETKSSFVMRSSLVNYGEDRCKIYQTGSIKRNQYKLYHKYYGVSLLFPWDVQCSEVALHCTSQEDGLKMKTLMNLGGRPPDTHR